MTLPEAFPEAGPKALPKTMAEALGEALPKVWVEHPPDRPPGGQSAILSKSPAHSGSFKRIYAWGQALIGTPRISVRLTC